MLIMMIVTAVCVFFVSMAFTLVRIEKKIDDMSTELTFFENIHGLK